MGILQNFCGNTLFTSWKEKMIIAENTDYKKER